jgi:hypothetical protein
MPFIAPQKKELAAGIQHLHTAEFLQKESFGGL